MKKLLIINGPNLNMLGIREPEIYGKKTLNEICADIKTYCNGLKIECDFFQSNCEGAIIDKVQSVYGDYDGCIINAGAYSHYSYAIYDAILSTGKPFIEVHLSNIFAREEFRRKSVIAPACKGTVCGLGEGSYLAAINELREIM